MGMGELGINSEVARRIMSFLLDLADRVGEDEVSKVLICSHMGSMRILVGIIEEQDNPATVLRFSFPNAEVYRLTWSQLRIPGFLRGRLSSGKAE